MFQESVENFADISDIVSFREASQHFEAESTAKLKALLLSLSGNVWAFRHFLEKLRNEAKKLLTVSISLKGILLVFLNDFFKHGIAFEELLSDRRISVQIDVEG